MKVVLLKDVKDVGKRYDVKNVSDGHALNFLIPRGLAQAATDSLVKRVESQKAADHEKRKKEDEALHASLEQIRGGVGAGGAEAEDAAPAIVITENANEKGHLFSAIHKSEIAAAIKKASGVELTPELIKLDKPIKETGEHTVEISAAGKSVKVKISVRAA